MIYNDYIKSLSNNRYPESRVITMLIRESRLRALVRGILREMEDMQEDDDLVISDKDMAAAMNPDEMEMSDTEMQSAQGDEVPEGYEFSEKEAGINNGTAVAESYRRRMSRGSRWGRY